MKKVIFAISILCSSSSSFSMNFNYITKNSNRNSAIGEIEVEKIHVNAIEYMEEAMSSSYFKECISEATDFSPFTKNEVINIADVITNNSTVWPTVKIMLVKRQDSYILRNTTAVDGVIPLTVNNRDEIINNISPKFMVNTRHIDDALAEGSDSEVITRNLGAQYAHGVFGLFGITDKDRDQNKHVSTKVKKCVQSYYNWYISIFTLGI